MTHPILTTERLTLRRPDGRDTKPMLAFLASDRAEFYGGPMGAGDAWRKFAVYVGQWDICGTGFFTIEQKTSGTPIGMVGLYSPPDFPEPELAWLIFDKSSEGQGYAFEATLTVLDYLFGSLNITSVVSYIDRANVRSAALAERLGAGLDHQAVAPIENCLVYRHFPSDNDGSVEAYA